MKQFIFLYPIDEYFNKEFSLYAYGYKHGEEAFKQKYKSLLNKCIDARYRKKGFVINYAIFDDTTISDIIDLQKSDRIIKADLEFKLHKTKQPDGTHVYPDPAKILEQLGNISVIRIAGFHLWDCVEKLAVEAHSRGIDTLVDEDLTEMLSYWVKNPGLVPSKYPSYNPREFGKEFFKTFIESRKGKPWLWQDY